MDTFSRPLRPVHLVLLAGAFALTGMGLGLTKIALMRNYTPPTTIVDGVATMTGPYTYDNNTLDAIWAAAWILGLVLVIVSHVWNRLRPTAE